MLNAVISQSDVGVKCLVDDTSFSGSSEMSVTHINSSSARSPPLHRRPQSTLHKVGGSFRCITLKSAHKLKQTN